MREGLLSVPLVLLQPTGPRTHWTAQTRNSWRLCFASRAPTSSPPWSSSPSLTDSLTARINGGPRARSRSESLTRRRHVVPPCVALPSSRGIGNRTHTMDNSQRWKLLAFPLFTLTTSSANHPPNSCGCWEFNNDYSVRARGPRLCTWAGMGGHAFPRDRLALPSTAIRS